MPKLIELEKGHYRYKCKCGIWLDLYTDEKPKRVPKCWDCLEKDLYKMEAEDDNKSSERPLPAG